MRAVDIIQDGQVLDLGELEGPLLVFGGPYSNLQATQAVQQLATGLGLAPQQVICTGDLVAYCGDPCGTAKAIRQWRIPVVMGNCEESLASDADHCGCGFSEGSACDLLASSWYEFASQAVSEDLKEWMGALPRRIEFQMGGKSFAVIHGGVDQINQFIFASTAVNEKYQQLNTLDVDVIIGGHCGIPFGQRLGARVWLNAGAIGMPANDGTQDGWYMLLSETKKGIECCWQRLAYDAEGAYQKMQTVGLNRGYDRALINGLWPSTDVLPSDEKNREEMPLDLETIII
ncbi:MAG: metallophosphoesterase family protein [Motiliproteus sp.]